MNVGPGELLMAVWGSPGTEGSVRVFKGQAAQGLTEVGRAGTGRVGRRPLLCARLVNWVVVQDGPWEHGGHQLGEVGAVESILEWSCEHAYK